tara:strand:+ start:144 stop:392 length:249 start_codon:yes stop_codon:yes gene_type:complete
MIDTDISLPVSTARSKLKKLAEIMNLNDSYLCKNRSEANALATSIRRCKFNKARNFSTVSRQEEDGVRVWKTNHAIRESNGK